MEVHTVVDVERQLRAYDLINSNEWKLLKELLTNYANELVVKGIRLGAEESNDRKRVVFFATARYFEDFITQLESQGKKEVIDNKEQGPTRQVVPEF